MFFFFSSRRRHTRFDCDWSSDVCSSDLHLGDEYLLHTNAQRVDLTFEAAELLVSKEVAQWRVYGGGEYLFAHSPADLAPGVLHGGLEYRQPEALVHFGRFATGRLVAGLDARSVEGRQWEGGGGAGTGRGAGP